MKPVTSALIFPETNPSQHDIGKLLFFFNSLKYYLPTENEKTGFLPEYLQDLCKPYAPAPLKSDLSRFNALLKEMLSSRPDELGRLFSSGKAPITTGQIRDRDESSPASVLTAVYDNEDQKRAERHKERLWQARLILKLAEIHNSSEEEVSIGLAKIAAEEKRLHAFLEGEKETEPARQVTQGPVTGTPPWSTSAMLAPVRLKAWAELFLADPAPDRPFTLVTPDTDSGEIILEGYENMKQRAPVKLFSLSMPEFPAAESEGFAAEQYLSAKKEFRSAVGETLEKLQGILGDTLEKQGAQEQDCITPWEEAVQRITLSTAGQTSKLDFFYLPQVSPGSLFQKLFHLEPTASGHSNGYNASLLAILSR